MRNLFVVLALSISAAPLRAGQHQDTHAAEPGQHHAGAMERFYGVYDAGREGSGTSWLPDSTLASLPAHNHGPTPANLDLVLSRDAFLVESNARFEDDHEFFARFEWVDKDELFPITDAFHAAVFGVGKVNLGYTNTFTRTRSLAFAAGLSASLHLLPVVLEPTRLPASAYVFLRAGFQ